MEKILIVEDGKDTQFLLSNILKDEGYQTIIAGDGDKALKELERHSPNLALLDIKLPDMNGMKLLEEMKKNEYFRYNHTCDSCYCYNYRYS